MVVRTKWCRRCVVDGVQPCFVVLVSGARKLELAKWLFEHSGADDESCSTDNKTFAEQYGSVEEYAVICFLC